MRPKHLLCATALLTGLCSGNQFGNLPLSFEPNQGQTAPRVRYLARSGNMLVFLTADGYTLSTAGQSVSMRIIGAHTTSRLTPERSTPGISNYYLSGRAITGIPHFERVRAQRIRPGIDAIFYGRDRQVEYDFVLQPGADPRSLTLRFTGAGRPKIDTNGDLVLHSGDIEFRHHKPIALQGGKPVECAYDIALNGDVRFHLGAYDPQRPLTIDPVLSYSTYLGGSTANADTPFAIAVDSTGAAYIGGQTSSIDFPVTTGGGWRGGGTDAFITKLNPSGTALVYSTFIGGSSEDSVSGVAVDASGNAYGAGTTYSSNFLTGYKSNGDVFVVKLNSTGRLEFGRLLGGISDDCATALALDAAGAIFVAGYTNSTGLATTGAAQTAPRGIADAFVAKLTSSGALSYFTYVGGGDNDVATAIAVDASGNAYVAGSTFSTDFPVTSEAVQKRLGGPYDAFIAVLNPTGTSRLYASYLGGSSADDAKGVMVDGSGAVYVAGTTYSADFPTTAGSFAPAKPSEYYAQGFAAKFTQTPAWSASYSTYIGGAGSTGTTNVNGMAVDGSGRAVIIGNTFETAFPTTPGALKPARTSSSESDLFVLQLNPSGSSIVYSTLIGGSGNETASAIALDANGGAYIAGATLSTDYPTTPGAFQSVNPHGPSTSSYYGPGVVSKIDLGSLATCTPQITPDSANVAACGGTATFQLSLAAGCPWNAVVDSGLTISGAQSGTGSASPITFNVTVSPNDSTTTPRTAKVNIGAATFTVNQPAWSCAAPAFNPASLSFDGAGGIRTIAVSMPSACSWTAAANAPWLTVTGGATGSGSRTVTVFAAPNSFATRSTSINVGAQSVPITQTGSSCIATASATPAAFTGVGGSGSAQIVTGPTCRWNAYATVPWIQVNQALSAGQGSGAAPFTVAQNPGISARTGALLIGDQTVAITQSAGQFGAPTSYTTTVFAGGGSSNTPLLGDGGPATSAYLHFPFGLALNGSTLYIADLNNHRLRAVTADGQINTVAGGGTSTLDGVAPTAAQASPEWLAFDPSSGYLYLSEGCRVRRIFGSPNVITTVAGSTNCSFSGDNGPATSARLALIAGLAVDSSGSVYVADYDNFRVRKIAAGIITTVAGGGSSFADGGSPTATNLRPCGIAVDPSGALYIADCLNTRIRKIANGIITTVAGGGEASGDGLPATSVSIRPSGGIGVDGIGAVYFGDSYYLRRVGADGLINTIGSPSHSISAHGIVFDDAGNVFVSDGTSSNYVLKLTPTPTFCTYSAGTVAIQPAAGGAFSIGVTAGPGCAWQASLSGSAPWVTLSGTQGSGNASVSVTLAPNTGVARTATLIVGGQAVTITQAGVTRVASDFNGDRVPDLIWQNDATRQVTVNYYGGSGGASYQGYNWLYTTAAPGWRVAAVADFNGDGVPDLVWQNEATGQASVHYYGGAGGAVDGGWNWLYPSSAPGWKIVAAADFDGDGVPDLVWQNEATRQVVVHYYGARGGAVDTGWNWLYAGSAPGWRVVAAADFNGDGVPDLVWQSEATRQVSLHYYGGLGGAVDQGWRWLNSSGAPGWKVATAADFNSDGVPDLVWINDITRQVTVHYYSGDAGSVYQGWNWLNSTGAPGWTITM